MYQMVSKKQSQKANTSPAGADRGRADAPMPTRSLYCPLGSLTASKMDDAIASSPSPLQMKQPEASGAPASVISRQPNHTGIPAGMKEKFESLSGFSFDDVRVHYHSEKPAQLQAYAYTQGNQVYVGPGQEKHLGHELGHVVQQKQGRVQPTGQIGGVAINAQPHLEREADWVAGGRPIAAQAQPGNGTFGKPIQLRRWKWNDADKKWEAQQLTSGESESPQPKRDGHFDGEVVDTDTAVRLRRAVERRDQSPIRERTASDHYMHLSLGDRTPILTPFRTGEDGPYLTKAHAPFSGPFVDGKRKPFHMATNKNGKEIRVYSTQYSTMVRILDDWCTENPEKRRALIAQMIDFMRGGAIKASTLFEEKDENAKHAADYFIATLTAAETHEQRANPDGGKLARAALNAVLEGETFTAVFVDDSGFFPQAQKKGNDKHRAAVKRGRFHSKLVLSDSSEEGEAPDVDISPPTREALPPRTDIREAPPPQTDIQQVNTLPRGLLTVNDTQAPPELQHIQAQWQDLARQYIGEFGLAGETVMGAAFLFVYNENCYQMPIHMTEGSFSWEFHIETIRKLLHELGATHIAFYPGKGISYVIGGIWVGPR